ncbi:ABC transporter permease [Roseburia sp. BX1005]|uniref:ABC transporter permease n=1 Tax=Roseburia zhanii TaxID=2763064 RepID=A0A923RTI5_9FIRM|nr:ABC transporter permease [Roseburia zhanii]MBC5714786.1 ABC transporter permease [Roseburia zhanii]
MLKNPNQKVIKRMARNALKENRRKTITLFLAVLLSSFLVFTIFTVGDSYFRFQKIQNIRMSGAEFDAIMYGVTDEQKQMCENNPDIVLTGTAGVCGWVEKTDQDSTPNVGLIWADDGYWTQMMEPVREKLEGSYPTALDEIMVTKSALKECGYEDLEVGDTLDMSYGTQKGIFTGTFRISGIWDGYGPKKQFFVSKEFYDQSGCKLSEASSGRYFMDFKQKIMTKTQQNAFIESMNLGKQQNLFFMGDLGASVQILAGIIGLIVVTCLCAYLLIYNIMYLSVAGKVRYYGLLQTVGMTEKQVKKMMRDQMFLIGSAGTVIGCLSGGLVSFFLIPVVVKSLGIKSGYVGAEMIRFHPAVLLVTILLVGVTLLLACQKPAKMAADISPIEALGYRPTHKIVKARKVGKRKVIAGLSLRQFTKDKKRTAVVLLSLAASLSVYLCIVTMLDSQAARTIVSNYMDTDMVITNDTACKEKSEDRRDILDDSFVKSIKENTGVSEVHSVEFAEITVPWEPDFAEMWMKEFYAKWMSVPYSQDRDEYQNHPENFGSSLIGIDEQEFDYLNNSLEHPINKENFLCGKACIVYRNGLDFADADIIGKNVTCALYEDQQTTKTFVIEGVTDENYYTALLGYPPTIITSDQVVNTFANNPIRLKTGIKYHKEYDRDTEQEILSLLEENDNAKDFSWESKIEDADEIEKAQGYMPQVGIGIVLILAFIGIMNYMNTFVVNVQSRMTELSVMESIGMTPKQLLGMLVREGILYVGGAWLVTLTVGLGGTYLLYESMNYRGITFSVPILPFLFTVGISVLVCTMIPVLTWVILEKNGTVVERIKGVE